MTPEIGAGRPIVPVRIRREDLHGHVHRAAHPPKPDPADPAPSFALGVGLTNECNLACSFCYRDPDRLDRLGPDQLRTVLDTLPVRSVNLGTGENGMHPQFPQLLDLLRAEPIKLTITSNGHSIAVIDDAAVQAFADVEFSIDYPTREEQDAQRGAGNWDLVMAQAARCQALGVGVTFIAVMMRDQLRPAARDRRPGPPLRRAPAHQRLPGGAHATPSRSPTRSTGTGSRACSPRPT